MAETLGSSESRRAVTERPVNDRLTGALLVHPLGALALKMSGAGDTFLIPRKGPVDSIGGNNERTGSTSSRYFQLQERSPTRTLREH